MMDINETCFVFQPIFSIKNNALFSYEVFLRHIDSQGNLQSAHDLISLATENNTIASLDIVILENIIELLPHIPQNTAITINISSQSLLDQDYVEQLIDYANVIKQYNRTFILELADTKSADLALFTQVIALLTKCGYIFCLDNFGAGETLKLLASCKIDYVKFNQDSLADLSITQHETKISRIYTHLVNMAHDNHADVIIAGIQTKLDIALAHTLQCDYYQGFGLGKPVPIEQIHTAHHGSVEFISTKMIARH
jgi:EAL domain-containing protein (putative c-di-GMP-specific phosphodiesterase class I)